MENEIIEALKQFATGLKRFAEILEKNLQTQDNWEVLEEIRKEINK